MVAGSNCGVNMYFKNQNNELFWLEENEDPNFWLKDCEKITDDEAKIIIEAQRAKVRESAPNVEGAE